MNTTQWLAFKLSRQPGAAGDSLPDHFRIHARSTPSTRWRSSKYCNGAILQSEQIPFGNFCLMNRIVPTLFLAAAASGLVVCQQVGQVSETVDLSTLKVGDYYRPQGALVSGFPDATTPFVRAPCPALNTLANHGYIPRNGKNVTRDVLKQAVITVFNIDSTFAGILTSGIPASVSLAYLGTHNLLEHDVSFAHADVSFDQDPSALDTTLWADLAARATNGQLGVREISAAARDRITSCKGKSTGCDFGVSKRLTMLGEAALILLGFGGKNGNSVRLDHAQSLLV